MLPRIQGFEFCDQNWLPEVVREGFMDCLNAIHQLWQPYRHIAPIVSRFAATLKAGEVLDLGSGGGGQVATVLEHMERQGLEAPHFVLSDLYPDLSAWQALLNRFGPERLGFVEQPVPFSAIPAGYRVLTIFSAFHHLPPDAARALLYEVVRNRDGILIVEFTRRTFLDLLSMLPAAVLNWLAVCLMRPRPAKLLLSPLIALMVSFDGIVSALRSYTGEELQALLPPGTEEAFVIEYGEVCWGRLPLSKATYFLLSRKERLESD